MNLKKKKKFRVRSCDIIILNQISNHDLQLFISQNPWSTASADFFLFGKHGWMCG